APSSPARADIDYTRQVKPILAQHCFACHAALKQQSSLRVDTAASMRKGGDSGEAIVAGNSTDSLLIQAVKGTAGFVMPPEGEGTPLTGEEIAVLSKWIDEGAKSPTDEKPQADPRKHWSYQPVAQPAVPPVGNQQWVRNPIDAFVAKRHLAAGLKPNRPAKPEVLLRRVYLDLIGLPPTREELHRFLKDPSDAAYEKVVNDLLARPQYGERWGRHWMDVWRYSDWYGRRGQSEMRYSQRHIWRWRDWIVESLNEDKGYDRMLREMLAGDEIAPTDPKVLRATGFLGRNWYKFDRNVWLFETVEQTSQAFLGLTLRCCRCHDHKFDAVTQQEYYQFRAFFEPHNVRTDALSLEAGFVKDSTLGEIPADGVSRVFDKELDVPTYLFERGNDRHPDKSKVLAPGVPAILATSVKNPVLVEAVSLPAEAFYPELRKPISESLIQAAQDKVTAAVVKHQELAGAAIKAHATAEEARRALRGKAADPEEKPKPFLVDDFSKKRDDIWQIKSGKWTWQDGKLIEKTVGGFQTISSKADHPRNFRAKVRYRTLPGGNYRSVGFSFDATADGSSQDVYTSCSDAGGSVQAFHRVKGKQTYPQAGIVRTPLKVGQEITVEVTVRESLLTIILNGEEKLRYVMPEARQDGKFELWVLSGAVEFDDVEVTELKKSGVDLQLEAVQAEHLRDLQKLLIEIGKAEVESVRARIEAERAKHSDVSDDQKKSAALAADKAERQVALMAAQNELFAAELGLALLKARQAITQSQPESDTKTKPDPEGKTDVDTTTKNALARIETLKNKVVDARAAFVKPDGKYEALGKTFPATSTGRRLALARWVTDPQNPRTARVAANHIWLRHFGEAIVESVADFGPHGKEPSHPQLLDWLASELTGNGWSTKHLHRLIVLSATYRQASAVASDHPGWNIDGTNRLLWRANSRRLEAEAVRDCVLAAAGHLDLKRGGAELPQAEGQTVFRRSLYFRTTPDDQMVVLKLFDQADPNACYRRKPSVGPQQALALSHSPLCIVIPRRHAAPLSMRSREG
ncbi:MAG: DUF1549 domain-containing protein, partial [Planctomycetes bacterium]|nr:DUF1549 domain-containing protein [Planctomycetota bacterium]